MNKKVLLGVVIFAVLIVIISSVVTLMTKGYLYVGDVWHETVEEALSYAADNPTNDKMTLTVKELLDKRVIGDIVEMTFVSENDTLTSVSFVINDDEKYCVYGYTEEGVLNSPSEFVLNGDKDQFILFPYSEHVSTVYGWCYSSVTPTVNGITPSTETFEFECQGKTWSLDFWWIDDFPSDTEVKIEYDN
jgi:hypothetical protein